LLGTLESLESFVKVGGEGLVEVVNVELCSQIRRLLKPAISPSSRCPRWPRACASELA
jgi:hypothetical protein